MIKTGLVSITFRKLSPQEIVELVSQAGLEGIEWGGDIHVPHGDIKTAQKVREMTEDAGLEVACYGSYYQVGNSESKGLSFDSVLETATVLGALIIRVWAGVLGSADVDESTRENIISKSRKIADMAANAGLKIGFEYHAGTLTDTVESAVQLFKEIDHDNVTSFWQPPLGSTIQENLSSLGQLMPWLSNIHVFQWEKGDPIQRHLLSDGAKAWKKYFEKISAYQGNRYAMLEFVKNDCPGNFLKDTKSIKNFLL